MTPFGSLPPAPQRPPRLTGGMSFTPSLPGPMKQIYDRIPQQAGPQSVKQFHDRIPQSSPSVPMGTVMPGPMPPQMSMGSVMAGPMPPSGIPSASPNVQTAWNVPPMGGALPADIGTALGVWSTTRRPPAAPHLGTPMSQTADASEDGWLKGYLKDKGVDVDQLQNAATDAVQQLSEGQKKVAEAQDSFIGRMVLASMLGGGPSSPGASMPGTEGRGYGPPSYAGVGGQGAQQAEAIPVDVLTALKAELAAKGATPEDMAVIDQLIAEQTARA